MGKIKHNVIIAGSLAVVCLMMSACSGGVNKEIITSAAETTTVTTITTTTAATTTRATETTKKTYYISESSAISLAKDLVERNLTSSVAPQTDKVYFGDVECKSNISDSSLRYGTVTVSGHYYKKDKYGNTDSKKNFTKWVTIDKENKTASFS